MTDLLDLRSTATTAVLAALLLLVAACSSVTDPTLAIDADLDASAADDEDDEDDDPSDPVDDEPAEEPADEGPADGAGEPDDGDRSSPRDDGTDASDDPPGPTPEPASPAVAGELEVHFLDVGQGDATLLLHDDVAVLVDTGRWQASDVVPHLSSRGVDALDLLVITHPHADHIGQFDQVTGSIEVDEVWWSGTTTTSQTFDRALEALERSDAAYEEPRAGDTTEVGPLAIEVVNPPDDVDLTDIHDAGLAFRVTFGEVRLLFTGDAEAATEARMVARSGGTLDADILQLGHHGSDTSTTAGFLDAVGPDVAIYSAGAGNPYGHPHASVIDRLADAGVTTYGTDVHGSVVVTTDGTTWTVGTAADGDVAAAPASGSEADPEPSVAPSPPATPPTPPAASPSPSAACAAGQVDVNAAGPDELQEIIHIGPDRAGAIPGLRPFASVQAMDRISGIGPARLADILEQGVACVG